MILISASQAVLRAYRVVPAATTPPVPSAHWYRMWRIDARKYQRKEFTLITNSDTLYTFVIDSTEIPHVNELAAAFMVKFAEVFKGRCGYSDRLSETILFHRAVDRSVIGVMNSMFRMIECDSHERTPEQLEHWLNEVPVVSRDLIPIECLKERFKIGI
jgi:hypothetical protein